MNAALNSFSELPRYRIAATALLVASYGMLLVVRLLGAPDWLGAILGLPLYVLLTVITYRRLRDAALSGGWIVLMILAFNVGPSWNGFHLSNLIILVPIILAWIAPANSGANPRTV
jgi:uncharacterized membrane protein YhaH (DUF805 family)